MDAFDDSAESPSSPPLDALEHQITALAAHIHAATYRLLCLIAEFDRRQGWGHWGVRSCAHWLNWKCGIGLVAAREKVRVARSLERLPAIGEAFRRGEVSYSKVRAMTRVATAENEGDLLMVARHGTAWHVEGLVRQYRKVQAVAESQRANGLHEGRYLRFRHDADGALLIEAKLPPETGELVLKALAAAAEALYVRESDLAKNETDDSAESCTDEAETPPPPDDLALYLPPGPAEGVRDDSAESLWCLRPAHQRVRYSARHADALVLMAESLLANGAATRSGGERHEIVVHVDAEVLADSACPGRSELADGPALASETARRSSCDAGVVRLIEDSDGMPLSVGRKTRSIPAAIHRALRARDRGCRFPGCTARHFFEGHHVTHWARGGETSLENLVQLCTFHHRLVHEGGYGVEAKASNAFVFTTPDGRVIEPVPENDSAESSFDTPIEELNRLHGLDIDEQTGVSLWDGTVMDYAMAIDGLLQCDDALILDGSRYPGHFPPPREPPNS